MPSVYEPWDPSVDFISTVIGEPLDEEDDSSSLKISGIDKPFHELTKTKHELVPKTSSSSTSRSEPTKPCPRKVEGSIHDQLYNACLRGDIPSIKAILDKHFVTLMPDEQGRTPLYAACMANQTEVVEYLIHYGYDVNHQDEELKTPLHIAFEFRQIGMAKMLINRFDANVKIRDKRNWTPLHSAIDQGYLSVASRVLKFFVDHDTGTDVSWIPLQAACEEGREQAVRFLLATKVDVNHVSSYGKTALSIACSSSKSKLEIVQALLDHGADPNLRIAKQRNACHIACHARNFEILQCLLTSPLVDVNATEDDGNTCLHLACYLANVDLVNMILKCRPNLNLINLRCLSPLHIAVIRKDEATVRLLIENGASTDIKDIDNDTPLLCAIIARSFEMVKLLCEYDINVNLGRSETVSPLQAAVGEGDEGMVQVLLEKGANPNFVNGEGESVLALAIRNNLVECVDNLLKAGANIAWQDKAGDSPLHLACVKHTNVSLIRILITNIVEHDRTLLNVCNRKRQTPISLACIRNLCDVVGLLIESGADLNMKDNDGNTSLHLAMKSNFPTTIIQAFKDHNADVNARNNEGQTALFIAAGRKHVDNVKVLLASGADPNISDNSGSNCLHTAVTKGNEEVSHILINHPMKDLNAHTSRFFTALYLATIHDYSDIAIHLIEKGCDVNKGDEHRNTPLHIAVARGQMEIVNHLLSHGADVNIKGQREMTPLHTAVVQGSDKAVALLLHCYPQPDTKGMIDEANVERDTALHLACKHNYPSKAKMLLERGASTTRKNQGNQTPFDYAVNPVMQCNTDLLEVFINHDSECLTRVLDSKEYVLHHYCRQGKQALVEYILAKGANKDIVCRDGSPLDVALDNGHMNIVRKLLEEGAHVSTTCHQGRLGFIGKLYRKREIDILKYISSEEYPHNVVLDGVDEDGETLFFKACQDKALKVIELLLSSQRDIGANKCNKFGKSPVYVVCEACGEKGNEAVDMLVMLLNSSKDIDVTTADKEKRLTPLHVLCQHDGLIMANLLLGKNAASINAEDVMDRTPLYYAQSSAMVGVLHWFKADLDKCDYLKQTALLFSCQQGKREVAEKLLQLQPNTINSCDNMNRTVMHHCTASKMLDVLHCVKDHDKHINAKDINSQSALHIAVMNEYFDSAEQLLEMGADPNLADKSDLTPLHMAKDQRFVDLLTEYAARRSTTTKRKCTVDDMFQWHQQLKENTKSFKKQREREGLDFFMRLMYKMPLVGFIDFSGDAMKEYHYIRNMLRQFMLRIEQEVKKEDDLLAFELMPSGSMNEETKVCMPDEGDFVCVLHKISSMLLPPTNYCFQTANVTLNLKEDYRSNKPNFVDSDGRVLTSLLFHRFYNAVQKALAVPGVWESFPQLYRAKADDITRLNDTIRHVNLIWHGSVFKWMEISVDIVPGIVFEGWKPPWCEDRAVLEKTQCCIVAKNISNAPEEKRPYLLQLGFTDADAAMFRHIMPEDLRDGYKLCKVLRQECICTRLRTRTREIEPASTYITSFMLKTATFHFYEEYQHSRENFPVPVEIPAPVYFAARILDKLAECLENHFLETYCVPAHDLLRNHFQNLKDDKGHQDENAHKITTEYCKRMRQLLEGNPRPK